MPCVGLWMEHHRTTAWRVGFPIFTVFTSHAFTALSFQRDLAVEADVQPDGRNAERHLRREFLVAFEPAAGQGFGHRLLDLALRSHAGHFQELADAHVELLFVHSGLLNALIRSMSARVDGSCPVGTPPRRRSSSTALARCLPSSTPHWSNEFTFHTAPCTKTLCS